MYSALFSTIVLLIKTFQVNEDWVKSAGIRGNTDQKNLRIWTLSHSVPFPHPLKMSENRWYRNGTLT